MDEINSDQQIVTKNLTRPAADALWSIALVTDAEALSAGSVNLVDLMQRVERLRRQEAGQLVLESCLPEIHCFAMLLAAKRRPLDGTLSPARFADEADWLGARIQVLALSHVEVTLDQMAVLDLANHRVEQLCEVSGQRAMRALPILLTQSALADNQMILRGWSRMPPEVLAINQSEMGSKVEQALRQRSRDRMAPMLKSLCPSRY